jgi:cobaltochelatase CobN
MGLYHPDYPTETLHCPYTRTDKNIDRSKSRIHITQYSLKWKMRITATGQKHHVTQIRELKTGIHLQSDITGAFIVIVSYTAGGETIDALIREYESQGRAVLNLFQSETTPSAASLLEELVVGVDANGPLERGVSAVTSLYSWSLDYNDLATGDGALTELESIDLEIIKAIQLYEENSLTSELGAQSEWVYAVTYPYFEGVYSQFNILH